MVDFAGWAMPLEYPSGTVTEHRAVRSGCGMFDVSHMGNVYVSGAAALQDLNRLLTNDIRKLGVGEVQYTLLCNDEGGVVDDMLVTLLEPDLAMIVPNAANTATVVRIVSDAVGADAVTDRSERTAILAVQGPGSVEVLARLGLPVAHDYMSVRSGVLEGAELIVSRTGYTGERGYELMVPDDAAVVTWETVLEQPQVTPCGLGARDTLRTEMGYALHGQDISPSIGPVAAKLSWAVAWDKEEFAGRSALQRQRQEGVARRAWGILLDSGGVPRPGMTLRDGDDREVGTLTSGTFSPSLRRGIGLGLLDTAVTQGDAVHVDIRGRRVPATVVRPPFVDSSPK